MNKTAISMPKSSPAILVNLLIIAQALNIARRNSKRAVQTQTLQDYVSNVKILYLNLWEPESKNWNHGRFVDITIQPKPKTILFPNPPFL